MAEHFHVFGKHLSLLLLDLALGCGPQLHLKHLPRVNHLMVSLHLVHNLGELLWMLEFHHVPEVAELPLQLSPKGHSKVVVVQFEGLSEEDTIPDMAWHMGHHLLSLEVQGHRLIVDTSTFFNCELTPIQR